jgi:copper chaperone CopZ
MKKILLAAFIVAALLLGSGAGLSAFDAKADSKAKAAKVEQKAEETIAVKKAIFMGSAIHCDLCAESIKQTFVKVKGVECVHVDVKSKLATFCFLPEETSWEKIGSAMGKAGFEAKLIKITDAECPCDKCSESCKHWAKANAKKSESCKKKGCPFASQCKKVCK